MKKLIIYSCLLLMILGVVFRFPKQIWAQEAEHSLIVTHLEARDIDRPDPKLDVAPKSGEPIEGIRYQLYQLKQLEDVAILSQLDNLSLEGLAHQAQRVFQETTDSEGRARFTQLPSGIYYGIAVKANQRDKQVSSFLVDMTGNQKEPLLVYPKIIWETGAFDLFKIGVDGKESLPLSGVTFELYERNGLSPIRVKKGIHSYDLDAPTTLTTDHTGHIKVSGLIPGEYYLKEQETVKGYLIDKTDIPITVEAHETSHITIKNIKENTPPPRKGGFIPYTGELKAILFLMIGGSLIVLAFILIRRYRKDESSNDKKKS
ncbi:TPA: LPXTG cell wall anchor domain-containing protein [Streptococcus equi subsp. zooepidemicus]|uniref:SpaA isopeptide-forming pilin-related protein n=1 Tax=Streptococcus equi TaxID=1336 RepID=UPI001E419295|nr:SpaA isopeptide-forming pilin-related protein [Streptococcus equi]MCD3405794.1 LPXTG cell wall anchor domain-containing protein [Streptococcus equi subsp. zooepidemicus]HEL0713924.1 LPXTG cell wall anchor domain-containing protein [Streptococcus equi subsp. zooepidemicus]HEL1105685.1 LPXTG cell wall anchor domain-containing protein [Streptococcus equi subsp. zooepidemicus]HEL1308727.1 LPXTG cell wall anchor domain-containing protein [Streptococcus equi subsp. zooepidemicus]